MYSPSDRSDSCRRNSFFENETTFVFITPRSRANLTTLISENKQTGLYSLTTQKSRRAEKILDNARSLQENLACSAANQSVLTIVAI